MQRRLTWMRLADIVAALKRGASMHLVSGRAAKLLWLAFFMLACAGPATAKRRAIGEPAPDAVLTLLDGTKLHLSDMRGQVVVLNFWAT